MDHFSREKYDLIAPKDEKLPEPNHAPIPGLKIHQGYRCILPECDGSIDRLSVHLHNVQKHRGRVHGVRYQGAMAGIREAQLQTFFAEKRHVRLFVVGQSHDGIIKDSTDQR